MNMSCAGFVRFVRFVRFVGPVSLAAFVGFAGASSTVAAQTGQAQLAAAQGGPIVRTSSIAGQVIDGDTGAAVPGAIVRIQMRLLAAASATGRAGGRGNTPLSAAEIAANSGQDFVMSDADGRFVFHDLPRGPAQLVATAGGYVDRPGAAPRPIQITADGQHLSDVKLRLVKTASVSGVIVDEAGEPLVNVQVRAMRRDVPAGAPRYALVGNARTDDRGLYRIDGLVPGQFFIVLPQTQTTVPIANLERSAESVGGILGASNPFIEALTGGMQTSLLGGSGVRVGDQMWQSGVGGSFGNTAAPPPPINGRVAAYQTTFYPGVTQLSQAAVISLRSGESRASVDWQVRPTGVARVSGVVTGSDGPAVNLAVRLVLAPGSSDDDALPVATTTTAADGSFVFFGVPTGQYIAKAQQTPRGAMPAGMPADVMANLPPEAMALLQSRMGGAGDASFLRSAITVGDRDVSGLSLAVRPGARVSGRVVFDGAAPPPGAQQLQVATVSLAPVGVGGGGVGGAGGIGQLPKLAADGTFKTGAYPVGSYTLNVTGIPGTWMIKSLTVGGRDASTMGFELGDTDVADVVVTYTDRISTLGGTIIGEMSAPLPNTTVIMVPADYRAWLANGAPARGQVTSPVQPTGAFNLGRPLPGDYLVAAVLEEALVIDHDLAFYDALARVATRVSVAEGEKKTVELRIVRSIR